MMVRAAAGRELPGAGVAPSVLVLGMGATGAACARYFAARGQAAVFADSRSDPPGLPAIREAMPGAALLPGTMPDLLPPGVEQIVVSPGVDLGLPVLAAARTRGVRILSDIDLFVAEARAPIVAITGSNGKSTVTAMVGAMLRGAGWRAGVGGNLGTPALDLLDPAAQAYVLELSSFQLERSALVPVAVAAVLNISPDHLDVHGGMAGYRAAKARIYGACRLAVINRDAPELVDLVPPGVPTVSFGLGLPAAGEFGLRVMPDGLWLARGWDLLLPAAELKVTGRHNLANALAALALASGLLGQGGRTASLLPGLRSFEPLPHRMAVVARAGGVTWIDDSKATNVGAAVTSVGSVDGPLVLIAGGDGKGAGFAPLATALQGRPCAAVLLGRDAPAIAAVLDGVCPVEQVADMDAAVRAAARLAVPGGTVLLAPACSSLDMFRDYGARGDAFAAAVRSVVGGSGRWR